MTRHGSHTESRMRENCTYGSMRGIRRKTAKHVLRVAEGRAGVVPHGASRPTLHPLPLPGSSSATADGADSIASGRSTATFRWSSSFCPDDGM